MGINHISHFEALSPESVTGVGKLDDAVVGHSWTEINLDNCVWAWGSQGIGNFIEKQSIAAGCGQSWRGYSFAEFWDISSHNL